MSAQAEDMAQDAANKAPEVADRASKTIHSTADTVEQQVRQKLSSAAGSPVFCRYAAALVLLPNFKISLLCGAYTRRLGENSLGFGSPLCLLACLAIWVQAATEKQNCPAGCCVPWSTLQLQCRMLIESQIACRRTVVRTRRRTPSSGAPRPPPTPPRRLASSSAARCALSQMML